MNHGLSVCVLDILVPLNAKWHFANYDLINIYKSCVHIYTTSKRIELESPGCSGFEENSKSLKT